MSNFPVVRFQARDVNGTAIPEAQLFFYESGTTTPLDVFSDIQRTTSLGAELLSDGSGYFDTFYMDPSESYRVVLADSDDVVIWTQDDVVALIVGGDGILGRVSQIASNPLDYGAIGDGQSNEASMVEAAIDDATGVVDLLGKTYRCDTSLTTMRSGLTIKNGTLDFSMCENEDGFVRLMGTTGLTKALTSSASAGDTEIALASVTGLTVGDLLLVASSADNHGPSYGTVAEIARIKSISGTDVTLSWPLRNGYTTSDSSTIERFTSIENVTLENVTFIGNAGGTSAQYLIGATCTDKLTIRNCMFVGCFGYAVNLDTANETVLDGCTFIGAVGGFVRIAEASCSTSLTSCTFEDCTYGIVIGDNGAGERGDAVGVTISGCVLSGFSSVGVLVEPTSQSVRVSSCCMNAFDPLASIGVGVGLLADDVVISSSSFVRGEYGIYVGGSATNVQQIGNVFIGQTTGAVDGIESGIASTAAVTGDAGFAGTGLGTGPGGAFLGGATNGSGVIGYGGGTSGNGVEGNAGGTSGSGVKGTGSSSGPGVNGVGGADVNSKGVYGEPGVVDGIGVSGYSYQGVGTAGSTVSGTGVYGSGSGSGGVGVRGVSAQSYGVIAQSDTTSPGKSAFRIVPQDTAPSSPNEGDVYANSTDHKLYFYNGSSWVDLTV